MKIAFSGISRAGGRKRCGAMPPRLDGAPGAGALDQRCVQLGDERLGAAVDARAHADLLQERDQPVVLHGVVVGEHLADVARIGQAPALGHAQEQARQPVGEIAADQQQVVVLELVEQLFGREVLGLQRADELQHVLVGDDVGRRGGQPPEQVVDAPVRCSWLRSAGRSATRFGA